MKTAILISLLSVAAFAQTFEKEVWAFFKSGDAAKAHALVEERLLSEPNSASLHLLHADLLMNEMYQDAATAMQKTDQIITSLTKAISLDPEYGDAYAMRSGAYANQEKYSEGIRDAETGLKLSTSPRFKAVATYNKGYNLDRQGRLEEALKAYSLSGELDPKYSRAYFGRGKIYFTLRMWNDAKTSFEKAVSLTPKLGPAWAYLAELHLRSEEVEEGMKAAVRAIELAPGDHRGYWARARAFKKMNQLEAMLADATHAAQMLPRVPGVHLLRGEALELLGRTSEAIAAYDLETLGAGSKAAARLRAVSRATFATRCGDSSTTFDVPGRLTSASFDSCMANIEKQWKAMEMASPEPQPARRPILGPPSRRAPKAGSKPLR